MTLKKSLFLVAPLMLVCLVMRPQSHGEIDNQFALPVNEPQPDLQDADLMGRIQLLEKRIADLEVEREQIQRSNRESRIVLRPQPNVPLENSGPANNTNGTTWRVHMLSHRSSRG